MNRPTILDLRPGHSFIEYMVARGYDVYLLDWGIPGLEDKDLKFDDYVLSCENGWPQSWAEFPTLGAVAIRDMPDKFHFVNYDHGRDGQECGIPPGTSYQYIYRPERDFLVEGWSHGGAARYKNDWEGFLSGRLRGHYIK